MKPAGPQLEPLLTEVSRDVIRSILIPAVMSDSKSLYAILVDVMIASKYKHVFSCDLRDHTLQIILNALWTSIIVSSYGSIASNNHRHPVVWQIESHCGIEETGRPGIIYINSHYLLHYLSVHGTSPMGQHLLAKAHIAKLK